MLQTAYCDLFDLSHPSAVGDRDLLEIVICEVDRPRGPGQDFITEFGDVEVAGRAPCDFLDEFLAFGGKRLLELRSPRGFFERSPLLVPGIVGDCIGDHATPGDTLCAVFFEPKGVGFREVAVAKCLLPRDVGSRAGHDARVIAVVCRDESELKKGTRCVSVTCAQRVQKEMKPAAPFACFQFLHDKIEDRTNPFGGLGEAKAFINMWPIFSHHTNLLSKVPR